MTREKTKGLFKKSSDFAVNYFDHTEVVSLNQVDIVLNQIYNDHQAQLKDKDDEIRRLNNLYADTIKDLGDALIEIEKLKEHITHLQNVYMKLDGKYLKLKTELKELKDNK